MRPILPSLLGATLVLCGCSDMLQETPDSYYEREDFFTTTSKAEMAVLGIYSTLPPVYGYIDGQAISCSDDTYYVSGTTSDNARRDIAHYWVKASNTLIYILWKGKYEQLNRANYTLDGIEGMKEYRNDSKLKQFAAEARFLRAQASFDLVRYWGDVPYKTSYTQGYEDSYLPRTDRQDIYEQILADLKYAIEQLPWADEATSPERATQGAARALMMRVQLARAGYSLSSTGGILERPSEKVRRECFQTVIHEWEAFEAKGYHGFHNKGYGALFHGFSAGTPDSRESLFEVSFLYPYNKGYWGTYIGPVVETPAISPTEANKFMGRANGVFRVVPEWKDFFEEQDERRDIAICTYSYEWDATLYNHKKVEQKKLKWYPGKWRREWMPIGYEDPNITNVNFCLLRYADVVLMAAEAYNELGETAKAWQLLNSVRRRAGATEITGSNYRQLLKSPKVYDLPYIDDNDETGKLRTALYWERGFELAFEGQRKYDLLRWGILQEALQFFTENCSNNNETTINYLAGMNFQKGKHELLPIPEDELQINFKLEGKNNPGY